MHPIDWLTIGAAFISGLLGSAHCAAMCGGIATSFSTLSRHGGWWVAAQPNLGRVLGYTVAGAAAGAFGYGLVGVARSPGMATGARVLVGLVLVVTALRLLDRRGRFNPLARPASRLWQRLRPLQQRLLPSNTASRRIALGVLWGWMPCGLSTTLLAAAWFQADARNGGLTMLAFGLGTLPLMLPLTWSGARVGLYLQRGAWRQGFAALILAAGVLTMAAPWLIHVPGVSRWLGDIGCVH